MFVPLLATREKERARSTYPWLVAGILALLGLALAFIDAGPGAGIREGFEWVSRADLFMSGVNESRPLLARANRRRSAFFWEERNAWFSDVWTDLRGIGQALDRSADRTRSGAFPFELPYRLVQMFSVLGDTVLDPFVGTGTTMLAAAASGRHSIGVDRIGSFADAARARLDDVVAIGHARIDDRLDTHRAFIRARHAERGPFGYRNARYGFPVVTTQEVDLELVRPSGVSVDDEATVRVTHDTAPPADESNAWSWFFDDLRSEALSS